MNVSEAIRQRRSLGRVKDTPVDREKIETMLESAVWAPNHHRTEPWKFFVLSGEGRNPLSRVLKEVAHGRVEDPESEEGQKRIEKISRKPFAAPTVIVVALSPSDNPKAIYIEDVCAVAAATQNMLLTAHELGLGAIWRSGPIYNTPEVKALFDLREDEEILGLVFAGEPDMTKDNIKRIPFDEKTAWIDTDQQ
ncbi:nitroreductase family protein [Salinicoccus halodurans]|uniref:Putative NAD(P)H nitroreductase n=1 Tax=Salinicoccus halodurans TaxID=407035 RepID=A0A0F7HMF1_9STAP|nr:nitroreductase [Salinicoccus halodurans]AKG74703.1 aminomethyltransferase [Salinicoccus halodurans]SFK88275.1 Nitroreductase [Salinicoccus halodurans]